MASRVALVNGSASADDGESIRGIYLKQIANAKEVKSWSFLKSKGCYIDLLRGSAATSSEQGVLKATFVCAVMSRKHARLSYTDKGTVCITDLGSLHGTFVKSNSIVTKLVKNKPHTLRSGDEITLGKVVRRDDKQWDPVTLNVNFLTEPATPDPPSSQSTKVASPSPAPIRGRTSSAARSTHSESDKSSSNRYGCYGSSSSASSDMSTSDHEDDNLSEDDSAEINGGHGGYSAFFPHTLAPVFNVAAPRPSRFCSILPLGFGFPPSSTDNDAISPRSRLPSISQLGLSKFLEQAVNRSGDSSSAARHDQNSSSSASKEPDVEANTTTATAATDKNPQAVIDLTGNNVNVQSQPQSQSVIDLTHFDELDSDIPLPSSFAENQLGVPSLLGNAFGQAAEKRVVYDSDGNELHDEDEDEGEDEDDVDEEGDEEARKFMNWIYQDVAAPPGPIFSQIDGANDTGKDLSETRSRSSSPMQISSGIPSRSPSRSTSTDAGDAVGNLGFVHEIYGSEPLLAPGTSVRVDEDREELDEIGILSFGEVPVIPPFAKSGPVELGKIFNFTEDDELFDRSTRASNSGNHIQDVAMETSTPGQDHAQVDIDANMERDTEMDLDRARMLEESQSSLFARSHQRDPDASDAISVEHCQPRDQTSRTSRIYERITNLRGRLGRNVVDGQLATAVARFLGGTSGQQPAQSEEELAAAALKRQQEDEEEHQKRLREQREEEERKKDEIRQVLRDEMRQAVGILDHRLSGLLQEVLEKIDNLPPPPPLTPPAPIRLIEDQSIQTEPPCPPPAQPLVSAVESESDNTSRKRKRSDDEDDETDEQGQIATDCDGAQSQSLRHEKRRRFWLRGRRHKDSARNGAGDSRRRGARRSLVSALGLVSLGMVATYAVLDRVSDEWYDWAEAATL